MALLHSRTLRGATLHDQAASRLVFPAVAAALGALLLCALPYAAGYLGVPPGSVFLGALNNVGDLGQYLAALRQGASGQLLYVDQYTSLHMTPVLLYPLYTTTGLLLAPLHLSPAAAYALLHAVAALALLAALWSFCHTLRPESPLPGYLLALFGGGLYVVVLLLSALMTVPVAPVALTAPEFSLFNTLLLSPHGSIGLAADLWALSGYLRWRRRRTARSLFAVALAGLLVSLSYPFAVPVLLAVLSLSALAEAAREGGSLRARGRRSLPLLLAMTPPLAVALYYAALFTRDPLWHASNMLHLPLPDPAVLVAAFGPLVGLALPSLGTAWRGDAGSRLLAVWAIVMLPLVLLPLPQPGRLLAGWSVPLALLAARTLARWGAASIRRGGMALSLSSVLLALLYTVVALGGRNPTYYLPRGEAAALRWLGFHSSAADVVMASAGSGNLIAALAPCRVVTGQRFETVRWSVVQGDVRRYYSIATAAPLRRLLLRRYGVTLVLDGPYERGVTAIGVPVDRLAPGFHTVYSADGVRIFAAPGRRG